jgi:hypothetical protein
MALNSASCFLVVFGFTALAGACTTYQVDPGLTGGGPPTGAAGAGTSGGAAGGEGGAANRSPDWPALRFDTAQSLATFETRPLDDQNPPPTMRWVRLTSDAGSVGAVELTGTGSMRSSIAPFDATGLLVTARVRAATAAKLTVFAKDPAEAWMDGGAYYVDTDWMTLDLDPSAPAFTVDTFDVTRLDTLGVQNILGEGLTWYVQALWVRPPMLDFGSAANVSAWRAESGDLELSRTAEAPAPESGALALQGRGKLARTWERPVDLSALSVLSRVRALGSTSTRLAVGARDTRGREVWSDSVTLPEDWLILALNVAAPVRTYDESFDADHISALLIDADGHALLERVEFDLP